MSEPSREQSRVHLGRWLTLAGAVLLIAACALFVLHVRRFQRFERFVTSIGGELTIEHHVPEWTTRWTGEDVPRAFGRIVEVRVRPRDAGTPFADAGAIRRLVDWLDPAEELRHLEIWSWSAGDAALAEVGRLDQLEMLTLRGFDSDTGTGWSELERLKNLRSLDLWESSGLHGRLRFVRSLPRLESLRLDGTDVHDDDLEPLTKAPSLNEVSLTNTYVTDAGIQRLAEAIPRLNVSDD